TGPPLARVHVHDEEDRSVTTYAFSTESPADVDAGLLILPVFEGGDPGPGVRETGLRDAFGAAKLTGKKGETLLVTGRDRVGDRDGAGGRDGAGFAAGAALLVGVGPKAEFDVTALRRALGRAAGTARRFGSAATTFPLALGARHATDAVQAPA